MSACHCGCGRETRIALANNTARGWVKGAPIPFVRGHRITPKRIVDQDGYVWLYRPEHSQADTKGYVREHRLVVEAALRHPLPRSAVVHHVDGDRANNAPSNLVVCESQAYHQLLHKRMRALAACGNPDWMSCRHCGQYDDPARMYVHRSGGRTSARHRRCHAANELSRQRAKVAS